MSIGIRTNDMSMNINVLIGGLIIFGLLASQVYGCAQTSYFEESSDVIFQNIQHPANILSIDSLVPSQHQPKCSKFKVKQLILPTIIISVGAFGVYNVAFKKLNMNIKNGMDNLRGNHFFRVDDYIQYLPALTYLTFGAIGIEPRHSFKERAAAEITAYITMTALTNIGKYSFKEQRPDSNLRNSFPSGHTATVFTGAELMREEYGLGIGIGAYSIAAGVAFLRIYNGRHWLNDVIAGAGVGILSARIGYWMLPLYQRWFKCDNPGSDILVISPAYNPAEHSFLINVAYTF